MIGPRYQKRQEIDRSWSITDTTVDDSRREHLIMMGLTRKQARMILSTLNRPMMGKDGVDDRQLCGREQAGYG